MRRRVRILYHKSRKKSITQLVGQFTDCDCIPIGIIPPLYPIEIRICQIRRYHWHWRDICIDRIWVGWRDCRVHTCVLDCDRICDQARDHRR